MSWIIPGVCAGLVVYLLAQVVMRLLKPQMPTDKEVNDYELELHVKHLAKMNSKSTR